MEKLEFAALQMTSSHLPAENLITVKKWVGIAAAQGANIVLLPENFAFMGLNEQDKLQIAENIGQGPIQEFLGQLAKEHGIWLIAGTMPIHNEEAKSEKAKRVTASCLVFNPEGKLAARYDKIHLFDVEIDHQESHEESRTIFPGNKLVNLETPLAKIGLSICYDLRFPELYRRLFNEGSQVFTVPSAFTQKTGEAHWEILLRARAIENFSYVVAANQSGIHSNGRSTFGHSMIIDPWGKILQILPSGEGIIMATLDFDYLKDIRRRFPVEKHQRVNKDF